MASVRSWRKHMPKNEISKMKSRERFAKVRNQKRKAVSTSVEPEVQSDYPVGMSAAHYAGGKFSIVYDPYVNDRPVAILRHGVQHVSTSEIYSLHNYLLFALREIIEHSQRQNDYEDLRDILRGQIEDEALADIDLAAADKEHGRVCLTVGLGSSKQWEKDKQALERLRYLVNEGYLVFEGERAQYGGWTYTFRLTELGRLVGRPSA